MTIANFDQWLAAARQQFPFCRLTARTTVANIMFTVHDLAGNPGAGTLSAGNTAAGVVPTDATAGCPTITFSSGSGYLSNVMFNNTVAARMVLWDRLFACGAYAFNANTTLAAQPSFSGRVPGTNYSGLELWYENVTAITTNQTVTVTYTNELGATGHTTGAQAFGLAPTLGRMIQLPLAAGDFGISKVESVLSSGATVGTFNILVLRRLWQGRVHVANAGDTHGPDRTGMPQIYADSALMMGVQADSTSSGAPDFLLTVASA